MKKLSNNSNHDFSSVYVPEESIMFISQKNTTFINSSFQNEVLSFFPEIINPINNSEKTDGDYDDSLDENSHQKNIPQEFYSKSSLNFSPETEEEIELNILNSSSSATDEDDHSHSSDLDKSKRFNLSLLISSKENQISPTKIILGDETRTTILIKNIPVNYQPKELLGELLSNEDLKGKFNFFYLPYNNKRNENYGFSILNFVNPFHVILFFEMYHKKKFSKYITEKSLELSYINYKNSNTIQEDNIDLLIPLKYLKLFKKIYRHAVCIVKDVNFCNEGMFRVKTLGRKN